MRRFAIGIAFAGFAGLAGCKGSTEPALAACVDAVLLTVGTGTTPTFSWDPACKAHELVVADSVANILWDVRSDSGSTMVPGVTYGVIPAGPHSQTQVPVALIKGKSYAVGLYRNYIGSPTASDVIDARSFRP